jgi:hypothetical protein
MMVERAIMKRRNFRFLVSAAFVFQLAVCGSVYAQTKASGPSITVYKTPT